MWIIAYDRKISAPSNPAECARRASDGRPIQFLGIYDDECVRTAEGARRSLLPRILGRPEGLGGRIIPLDQLAVW